MTKREIQKLERQVTRIKKDIAIEEAAIKDNQRQQDREETKKDVADHLMYELHHLPFSAFAEDTTELEELVDNYTMNCEDEIGYCEDLITDSEQECEELEKELDEVLEKLEVAKKEYAEQDIKKG